jgi:hypothetical protein
MEQKRLETKIHAERMKLKRTVDKFQSAALFVANGLTALASDGNTGNPVSNWLQLHQTFRPLISCCNQSSDVFCRRHCAVSTPARSAQKNLAHNTPKQFTSRARLNEHKNDSLFRMIAAAAALVL